jgi:hypothetical protein
MKRWGIMWACLGLLLFTSHALAIGPTRVGDIASIIPEDTALYFVMRTDDQVLDDLNGFIDRITNKLTEFGIPGLDLEEELRRALDDIGTDYDEIRPAIGDYMAIAADLEFAASSMRGTMNGDMPQGFEIYIQVADRQKLEALLGFDTPRSTQGAYTLYKLSDTDFWFALSDQWLVILNDDQVPDLGASLARQPGYQSTLAKLPADDYVALVYVSAETMGSTLQDTPREVSEITAQHILLGLALQDERHLILDVVQTVPQDSAIVQAIPNIPLDQSFLRYVPEDAAFLLQLNDPAGYIDYLDLYLKTATPGFDIRHELELELGLIGLDLDEDMLSWMQGEAVLYVTFDIDTMIETIDQFDTVPFEFGLVVETTDSKAARNFYNIVTRMIKQEAAKDRVLRVASHVINGVGVTTIRIEVPNQGQMLNYEIVIGVTDEVVFIASEKAAQFITAGRGESILDNADYVEASALYVPQSKQLFYVSDDGLITVGAGLAYTFLTTNPLPGMDQFRAASPYVAYQPGSAAMILNLLRDILHSASVTTSVSEDGIQINRVVFSLE